MRLVRNGDSTQMYLVRFEAGREHCTCPDFQHRQGKAGHPCNHIIAAQLGASSEVPTVTPEPASRSRGRAALALLNDKHNELPPGWQGVEMGLGPA